MKKNQLLLALLTATMVISVAAYGALVIFQKPEQKNAEAGISLAFGDQESIEKIAYVYQDESIVLVRQENGWILETDPKLSIDQKIPQRMCELMETIKASREISGGGASQDFGLALPQTTIGVITNGEEHILSIGLRNTNTREYYVSIDGGDAAFLVNESIFDGFQYGKADLYFPPEPVSLYYTYATSFSYLGEQGTWVEFVKEGSTWQRKGSSAGTVDQEALSRLMKQFCTIKIKASITAPGAEQYGLEKPVQIVSLSNAEKNVTISFGSIDQETEQQYICVTGSDKVYDDCVYTVDAAVLEAFQEAAKEL